MKSQELRKNAPELDPLRLGSGWEVEDLSKPQIIVESSYGHSHPGSAHLNRLVHEVNKVIYNDGGRPANYYGTDICDGEAQGHDGMNYSLVSRDIMAAMIEIHVKATPFDAGVFLTSCDKSVPAHLMAIARLNMPAVFMPGGIMKSGPDLLTLEQIGKYSAMFERGEITEEKFMEYKRNACPACGACSFMGTASTMQVMAEALGLALPGSALIPTHIGELEKATREAGRCAIKLAYNPITPAEILTEKAFENAIMVHAAIAGSSNSLLHLPAIAHEVGITLSPELFDRIHRKIPYILNIRPSGYWPGEYFWYAGGTPAIMEEISGPAGRTMWDKLGNVNEHVLANYLKNEYPQTIAVILSKIKAEHAAKVIALLPENFAMEIVMRMLRMDSVQKEVLDGLEKTLRKEFMSNLSKSTRRDSHELIADIFNSLDRNTEGRFMEALEERNRESAERVKSLMFTFEDLVRVDSQGIQVLLRNVDKDKLAIALKGASETIKDLFFNNMSSRAGKIIKEDMEAMGPVRLRDVEEAQQYIVTTTKELSNAGEIVISEGKDNDELIY